MSRILGSEQKLLLEARQAKRTPNAFLATMILVLILLLSFLAATIGGIIALGDEEAAEALLETPYGLTVPFVMIVLLLTLWLTIYEKRSIVTVGLAHRGFLKKIFSGITAGFVMSSLAIGLMVLTGCASIEGGAERLQGSTALNSVLLMLAVFLVQAGGEEIVLRGWYLPVLGARYQPWIGVVISSIVFAAMHAPTRPIAIMNLLLFGLFAALYCLREGSVWGIWGWHTAWNWTQGNLFGLPVSGNELWGGTLWNLKGTGPSALSGAGYGLEGSLFGTLVLLAGIAILVGMAEAGACPRNPSGG